MARRSLKAPTSPALLLPSYTAFKKEIEEEMAQEEASAQQELKEFTQARALLKKGGATKEAIALTHVPILRARQRLHQKFFFGRMRAETQFITSFLNIINTALAPNAQALTRALCPKKRKSTLAEEYAEVTEHTSKMIQVRGILEKYSKDREKDSWVTPDVSSKENAQTLEAYMQARYKRLKRLACMATHITHVLTDWNTPSPQPTPLAPPPLAQEEQKALPLDYAKAAQDCMHTGHIFARESINALARGDIETALSNISDTLSHWDLAKAFLVGPTSPLAVNLAMAMDDVCSSALTPHAWKTVESAVFENRQEAKTQKKPRSR